MLHLIFAGEIHKDPIYRKKLAVLLVLFKHKRLVHRMLPSLFLLKKILAQAVIVYLYDYPEL